MKKLFLALFLLFTWPTIFAVNDTLIFNGNNIPSSYNNKQVVFGQTLYVCGRSKNYLQLSYERIQAPEEIAEAGSAAYTAAENKFQKAFLALYCPNVWTDTVRLGATIDNLTATVTAHHEITSTAYLKFDNKRPTTRPDVGNARLIVCAANIQNYFPKWSGTTGASSDEEYQRQHKKIIKALRNIDADIFCLAEVQDGNVGVKALTHALNSYTAPGTYAYVDDGDTQYDEYTKVVFIYRTDKVKPALALGHPYTSGIYYKREYVQAFDELSTGERFVLCMNHFKSKAGSDAESSNSVRLTNVSKLIDFVTIKMNSNYYGDSDFLILGDLNCATKEAPIQVLSTMGFENQTDRFAPKDYSYVYNNGVEYLDHVFSTSSMSSQITGVAPYHINADESSIYHYKNGTDESMYRYADHDPIVVGLRLGGEVLVNEQEKTSLAKVYGTSGYIVVSSLEAVNVTVFDLLGRTVFSKDKVTEETIGVKTGMYIVRVGNFSKKVLVSD
ncbi:MAG: endonuclease/exonuclease/phosphatase family protein [Bacteroidales bacterium]|nr:endonuclease/exonuclease/phosphatase family protein [Bacteroidales bacterium]